jgi:hypothetical protein
MNLVETNIYTKEEKTYPLEQFVAAKVDGSDYETGELEAMCYTIRNQTTLIAGIIETLNLSDEQLTTLLAQYNTTLRKA